MRYTSQHLIRAALVFLFVFMTCVTGLLLREYYYFHGLAEELVQTKQEYNNYIIAFKRLVNDEEQNSENQADVLDEKKKLNSSAFLVINRDSDYTRKQALEFARCHNLELAVAALYSKQVPEHTGQSSRRRIRRSAHRARGVDAHQQSRRWEHLKREPIFAWPIDKKCFYLSSPFGPRKYKGVWGFHTGIDMAAVRGTPVTAALEGTVIFAGYSGGYGNTIVIAHNKKFKTRYAHLEKVLVTEGQRVCIDQVIGKVGDTGNVRKKGKDASHLHFEVYLHGKQVNPFYYLI